MLFVVLFQACHFQQNKKVSHDKLINTITEQLSHFPEMKDTLSLKNMSRIFPRTLTPSGKLHLVGKRDAKELSKKTQNNIWIWSLNRLLQTHTTDQFGQINSDGMWIYNQ